LYHAQIDGSDEQALFPYNYSLSASGISSSASDTSSFAGATDRDVTTSIGIRTDVLVSAGDTATLNDTFIVGGAAVPEPSSLLLAGLAALGLCCVPAAKHRRQK
jgi:hypothetical protein